MKAGWNPALEARVRRPDATARIFIDGRVEAAGQSDLRQQQSQWATLDAIPANVETLPDGRVRLKATGVVGPQNLTVTAYARDIASGAAAPFMDPMLADGKKRLTARVDWGGNDSHQVELTQIQAWLHPRFDPTVPKTVAGHNGWHAQLYQVVTAAVVGGTTIRDCVLLPIAEAFADAPGEAAGWVSFAFPAGARPRPKALGVPHAFGTGAAALGVPVTILVVTALQANGQAASNVGWGYDGGNASAGAGNVVRPLLLQQLAGAAPLTLHAADTNPLDVPACQFTIATHTNATIAFTGVGNRLALPGVPAIAPELVLRAEVPPGCAVTGKISADNVTFYPYNDGDTVDKVGPGLPLQALYYWKCDLATNAAGDRTPLLVAAGLRVVTTQDLSDVAFVRSVSWVLDPLSLVGETPQLVLAALHDGERDFQDAITRLLSLNPLGQVGIRLWVGDAALPRGQWMHLDDFLIDDTEGLSDSAVVTAVSTLALLRGALPVMTPESAAVPIADASNPGGWTASSGANLWSQLADNASSTNPLGAPDDTTYILSPTAPANQFKACTVTLAPLAPPAAGIPVQIQFRYAADAGGHNTHLTVDLMEGATVRATVGVIASLTGWTLGTWTLTPPQIAAIGNWANLSLRFTSGILGDVGQAWVSWARLAELGIRPPLVYANQTLQAVAADLLQSQIALDARYRGPPIVDPGVPITVSKVISARAGGTTDLSQAKTELDNLASLAGGFWGSFQGRVAFRALFDFAVDAGGNVTYTSRTGLPPLAVIERAEMIEPIQITPGLRQRVPEYYQPWGYTDTSGIYAGEAHGFSAPAFASLGLARVDPISRAPEGLSRWIPAPGLANGLAARQVTVFGLGLLEWRFRTQYAHPELELGDPIAIETDRFIAYDPVGVRPLAGRLWATGFVVGIYDEWGRDLEIWIPSTANISGGANLTPPGSPPAPNPDVVYVGHALKDLAGGYMLSSVSGSPAVQSVRVAASTSSFPAPGTGTLLVGQGPTLLHGPYQVTDTVYVTVTPYATADGSGAAGIPLQMASQPLSQEGTFLRSGTGLVSDGQVNPAQLAPAFAAAENDIVLNGLFEQRTTNWRQTSGAVLDTTGAAPIEGARSGTVVTTALATHRIQQCDRETDSPNSGIGNPVYTPVNPLDEIYGSIKFKTNITTTDLWKMGVEEYDATKTLIQRTYLVNAAWINGTQQYLGGVALQPTTRYIVPIIEILPGAGSGAISITFDEFHLYRVPARQRAHVYRSAAKSIATTSETPMDWDTEAYDVGNLHDNVTNNPRLTVQAAAASRGTIRLMAQIQWAVGATGYRRVRIRKNGATVIGEVTQNAVVTVESTQQCFAVDSAPAAGDFYEVLVTHTQGANLNVNSGQWASYFIARHEY